MTFFNRFALIALLGVPAVVTAQGRTAIALAVGPSIPTGRLRDTQTGGTDISIGLIRGSDDTPMGFRFDAAYDRLNGKTIAGVTQPEKRTTSGSANLLFSFAGYSFKPYVMAGVGGFKMTSKPSTPDSKIRFGFDFGLGFTLPLAGKAVFLETRLNSITQPNAKPLRYVPIVFGFLF